MPKRDYGTELEDIGGVVKLHLIALDERYDFKPSDGIKPSFEYHQNALTGALHTLAKFNVYLTIEEVGNHFEQAIKADALETEPNKSVAFTRAVIKLATLTKPQTLPLMALAPTLEDKLDLVSDPLVPYVHDFGQKLITTSHYDTALKYLRNAKNTSSIGDWLVIAGTEEFETPAALQARLDKWTAYEDITLTPQQVALKEKITSKPHFYATVLAEGMASRRDLRMRDSWIIGPKRRNPTSEVDFF